MMKFDEFVEKLDSIKQEFKSLNGRDVQTIEELETFLKNKKLAPKLALGNRRSLKSLKGFNI